MAACLPLWVGWISRCTMGFSVVTHVCRWGVQTLAGTGTGSTSMKMLPPLGCPCLPLTGCVDDRCRGGYSLLEPTSTSVGWSLLWLEHQPLARGCQIWHPRTPTGRWYRYAVGGLLLLMYSNWVKTLSGSSGPAAVAQPRYLPSCRCRWSSYLSGQVGVERPTRVLLPALLVSAEAILPEGIVVVLLQPIFYCSRRVASACACVCFKLVFTVVFLAILVLPPSSLHWQMLCRRRRLGDTLPSFGSPPHAGSGGRDGPTLLWYFTCINERQQIINISMSQFWIDLII
jgi:hypothetical protein